MTKKAQPIESFGPEMMAALLKGSREKLTLEFPAYRSAVYFMARIHLLRKQMREANHPEYNIAARARVSLSFGPDAGYPEVEIKLDSQGGKRPVDREVPAKITISPHDSEFGDVLKNAGVEIMARNDPAPTAMPSEGSFDSVLDGYAPKEIK